MCDGRHGWGWQARLLSPLGGIPPTQQCTRALPAGSAQFALQLQDPTRGLGEALRRQLARFDRGEDRLADAGSILDRGDLDEVRSGMQRRHGGFGTR